MKTLPTYGVELRRYNDNVATWYKAYPDWWVLLKDDREPQFLADEEEAYFADLAAHPDGVFFLKQIVENPAPIRIGRPVLVFDGNQDSTTL